MTTLKESILTEDNANINEDVPAGEYWMRVVKKGETLRITDVEVIKLLIQYLSMQIILKNAIMQIIQCVCRVTYI